ncbi:serine/threonine-protein kinase 11-interacting protein isoform X1 [Dermacentor variabilis]|uniref:serine/threonine-protein kinase 11-interacting protein isoform X1 n=1 Tax=Dermacentor variabilis TaxID=34621 RepID=UPI003F5C6D4D
MTPDSNRCERIRSLAAFLREHGDVVLNGTRRLTLTTSCLNELNYIFRQFLGAQENDSFDVPFGCGANSDFVYDVFFLHDFMQKTCSLKIVQSSQTIQGSLDLSKFHSLKILELKRVPPHLLVGFDYLVLQVETLICQRNISSLKEILRSRNKVPQPWVKIKVANFSYNGITVLDDSLALVPRLQYLDCSNNAISDAKGVEFLHNIRVLNLSFNFIQKISISNTGACDALTVLYLRNNFIEDTSGLGRLRQLRELDLSYNCLAESSSLAGFKQLYSLAILRLVGNPVTFHQEYHSIVVCHLHHKVVTGRFRLDDKQLPKCFIKPTNTRQPRVRQADAPVPDPVISVPPLQLTVESDDSSSLAGEILEQQDCEAVASTSALTLSSKQRLSASFEQDGSSCSSIEAMDPVAGQRPREGRRSKKRQSSRVATILDQEGHVPPVKESGNAPAPHDDFLTYKSQLESRKEQLGEEWLVGVSALRLPDAQSTPCGTPGTYTSHDGSFLAASKTASGDTKDAASDSDSGRAESLKTVLFKEPVVKQAVDVVGEGAKDRAAEGEEEGPQRRISELSQGVDVLDEVPPDPLDESGALSPQEGFSWTTAKSALTPEAADISEDMDSKLFLVRKCSDGIETSIFVGVKDDVIRESDSLTGKIIHRMDLNVLSSVSLHDNTVVKLKFDTSIRSKKERCYVFDCSEDAEEVVKMLQPFVEAKARRDLYSEMLQCVKCNAQFPKQAAKKVVVCSTQDKIMTDMHVSERCPQCGGAILLTLDMPEAVDALSYLSASAPENISESLTIRKASNSSSVGQAAQDNVSEESIETVTPDQHSSLHRPGFRKSASDITILSNPSQSSIMVISTTSAHDGGAENARENDKTMSPPPTVVLPTLKEIVEEPILNISRTDSISIGHRSRASASDTMLSDASFKSAQSQPNMSLQLPGTSESSRLEYSVSAWDLFDNREELGPACFTCPDHSVLLHLDVNVFARDETLMCCVEVDLVTWSSLKEVPALLVISSSKAYFFKIRNHKEEEDPGSWLVLSESRLLENLKVISLLLGNQGFCLSWQVEKGMLPWYTCLLRDADTCNCFLQCLTGVLQERMAEPPTVVMDVSESLAQVMNQVIKHSSEDLPDDCGEQQEVSLFVMGFWSEHSDAASPAAMKSVCIVVTEDSTYISKSHYMKTPKGSTKACIIQYEPLACQRISNVTAAHLYKNAKSVKLTFLDEDTGTEMQWTIATKTVASLHSFLSTLRTPWEELFGVEMPLDIVAE